jgi:hypothetical protein
MEHGDILSEHSEAECRFALFRNRYACTERKRLNFELSFQATSIRFHNLNSCTSGLK